MDNRYTPPGASLDGASLIAAANNSGGGGAIVVPEGVKGWSWGAFLFNWFWAVFNKTWIGLLMFVPLVNLYMQFYLGFKGRELAWRNKRWDNLEHFQRVQRKWSVWGVWVTVVSMVLGFAVLGLLTFLINALERPHG